jgi:dCMP deaminase
MKTAIVAYIPVLHQGYINFFVEFPYTTIIVLGRSLTHHHRSFQKDIRALQPATAAKAIKSLNIFDHVDVIEEDSMDLLDHYDEIVLPDEDICHEFAEKYCEGKKVIFGKTFLRWDSNSAKAHKDVGNDGEVELSPEDTEILQSLLVAPESESGQCSQTKVLQGLLAEADKSVDQYRQVAAAVFKKGQFCFATHNKIVPLIYTYFYEGDPRSQFKKGVYIDHSISLHSEAGLVAKAAKEGIALEGSTMIVTDFPCPPCSKQIAFAGIKKLYYLRGYAVVDGEDILREKGVEIYKIKTTS